ncbi:hypothetical protein HDV00_005625 [Rhizophlyctis rosea]|nr:hypothetical protein HDV00_005625 [Rhizophlyctis rosea]
MGCDWYYFTTLTGNRVLINWIDMLDQFCKANGANKVKTGGDTDDHHFMRNFEYYDDEAKPSFKDAQRWVLKTVPKPSHKWILVDISHKYFLIADGGKLVKTSLGVPGPDEIEKIGLCDASKNLTGSNRLRFLPGRYVLIGSSFTVVHQGDWEPVYGQKEKDILIDMKETGEERRNGTEKDESKDKKQSNPDITLHPSSSKPCSRDTWRKSFPLTFPSFNPDTFTIFLDTLLKKPACNNFLARDLTADKPREISAIADFFMDEMVVQLCAKHVGSDVGPAPTPRSHGKLWKSGAWDVLDMLGERKWNSDGDSDDEEYEEESKRAAKEAEEEEEESDEEDDLEMVVLIKPRIKHLGS